MVFEDGLLYSIKVIETAVLILGPEQRLQSVGER